MAFIFYDTETTGLAAGFDQILQFAGIVTDDDLNPIEEINLRCRLQPHVIPSPGALVITGVRPSDIAGANLSHYEMIREIRALIERYAPAVIVGYNSISYDEGMLRQAFYQTLNPTYLTNTGGNMRMDVLKLAHAASQYAPDVLQVPLNDKGKPSFKLELLAPTNGLTHLDAHEALSDTQATLDLARLIRDRAPAVWEAMRRTSSKQGALAALDEDVFCSSEMMFGQPSILATKIAANPDNPSEVAVFDLSHDPTPYLDTSEKDMSSLLRISPRPIRIIKANQSPIVTPHTLSHPGVAGHGQTMDQLMDKVRAVREHPTFARNVAGAVATRYPEREAPAYVEQRIFEGFPSAADNALMEQFHAAPWADRPAIVSRIQDARLRELGERLIYLEHPDALTAETRQGHDAWRKKRFHAEGDVPWVTVTSAYGELDEIKGDPRAQDGMLAEIREFVDLLR
ncbi:exonuclease domain-containing protein [Magnetovibrio sp.]|uniref:exonuclease domain-containing protein n=1 Tax=Magnetovibrio sp. TaxID=2024836 RepID=UPI002F9585A8